MGGQDGRIVPMLDHAYCHTCHEGLCRRVEVAEHEIDVPPNHEYISVSVDSWEYKCHVTSRSHCVLTDIGGFETKLWDVNIDGLPQSLGDICDTYGRTFLVSGYCHQWRACAGAVSL